VIDRDFSRCRMTSFQAPKCCTQLWAARSLTKPNNEALRSIALTCARRWATWCASTINPNSGELVALENPKIGAYVADRWSVCDYRSNAMNPNRVA